MESISGSLCHRKSTRYFKVPLKSTEQIYLIFLLPALISCVIYIVHFSADLVVAVQHFREGNPVWASCTIGLMYAPAITYFLLTVSRPDWWMTDDDKVAKGLCGWFVLQTCHLFGFVFFALYRYAGLIVLSVDALILSGNERIKTLNAAAAPAAMELYFFLQAWFQAAPQAVFQTHLLFRQTTDRTFQSVSVQVLCILMSIMIVAIQTTSFQRFESQRVNGRKLPWAMWLKRYRLQELTDLEERAPLQSLETREESTSQIGETSKELNLPNEIEQVQNEEKQQTEVHGPLDRQVSVTPPLPPKNVHITPPPTPLRGITTVAPLPIPDVPAPPRPDSICRAAEAEFESTKPVSVVQSNQRLAESGESLKVPKRKYSSKGLEEDDPVGKFLSFLWWFFFILARILSMAIFYEFYPLYLFIVIGIHYAIMLMYLFFNAKYYDVITIFVNLWLGLVYIFSLIEYRIKFKYADKWLWPYYVFVFAQNAGLTLGWYFNANWNGFWYGYVFCIILGSMLLCVLSTAVYHALLKPKKRRVYSS